MNDWIWSAENEARKHFSEFYKFYLYLSQYCFGFQHWSASLTEVLIAPKFDLVFWNINLMLSTFTNEKEDCLEQV